MRLLVVLFLVAGLSWAQSPTMTDLRLIEAAARGDLAEVQRWLRQGTNVNARNANGRTALTAAALGNHLEVARALIAAGADPDSQDDQRNNALLVTGETGNVAMLRVVLKANPNLTRTNRFGGTALIPAADRGHLEYVREILKTKINLNYVNNLGWTALLEAIILGDGGPRHTEIVRLLIGAGAEVNLADREGVTPLQHARRRGYTAMVKLLEQAGGR
jgi:ankyrin repeat protein